MIDLLRDPVWQFVGAAIALIAVLASLALYFAQRQKKALTYEILSRSPLLSTSEELEGKFQILFEGAPVSDVTLVILKLTNTGNRAIIQSDYERPVACNFGENAKILSAVVSETTPKNLRPSITTTGGRITINPILLNSSDSMTLKCLLTGFGRQVGLDGRIADVRTIEKHEESLEQTEALFIVGFAVTLVGVLAGIVMYPQQMLSIPYPELLPFILLMFVGIAISSLSFVRNPKIRKTLPYLVTDTMEWLIKRNDDR